MLTERGGDLVVVVAAATAMVVRLFPSLFLFLFLARRRRWRGCHGSCWWGMWHVCLPVQAFGLLGSHTPDVPVVVRTVLFCNFVGQGCLWKYLRAN